MRLHNSSNNPQGHLELDASLNRPVVSMTSRTCQMTNDPTTHQPGCLRSILWERKELSSFLRPMGPVEARNAHTRYAPCSEHTLVQCS